MDRISPRERRPAPTRPRARRRPASGGTRPRSRTAAAASGAPRRPRPASPNASTSNARASSSVANVQKQWTTRILKSASARNGPSRRLQTRYSGDCGSRQRADVVPAVVVDDQQAPVRPQHPIGLAQVGLVDAAERRPQGDEGVEAARRAPRGRAGSSTAARRPAIPAAARRSWRQPSGRSTKATSRPASGPSASSARTSFPSTSTAARRRGTSEASSSNGRSDTSPEDTPPFRASDLSFP